MTITEQKAFLQTYTGKAQAPAHPAQDWADAVKELHFEAQTAPVEFANAYGVYERLTITYEGRTVTARVIRPASAGQHPLLLMYHDLNRGVRGWHHMTRFLALGFGTVALEAEPYKGDWLAAPAQAEFRTRYKDALELPWVDAERVYAFGEGFGGGLALLTACLLPEVRRCAVLNPLPGDFAGAGVAGQDDLDLANFAPLCRAEVLLGSCLMDTYAPPQGQAAIYNRLGGPKQWKMYPKYVHERVNFFENQMLFFFKNGIAESTLTQNFIAKKCAAVCTLRRCLFLVGGVFCQHIAYGAARGQSGGQGADVLPSHRRRHFFCGNFHCP